jgi:hypothetical protein
VFGTDPAITCEPLFGGAAQIAPRVAEEIEGRQVDLAAIGSEDAKLAVI